MIVVSDTSPFITLAKLHCLDAIPALFGTVLIPRAVERELNAKGIAEGVADVLSTAAGWLVVQEPTTLLQLPKLHVGEVAAISLAVELHAGRLLIDEKRGQRAAVKLGVRTLGAVGVLVEAADRGIVDLDDAFARLKLTDFRFPHTALDALLADHHRRRLADK